jgi:quercetin dioxygenase-like cupin family protein
MTDDSKVREVASLVTYQPGSVVSKVLMKVPNGSVTLFAFSAGSELSEHTAPFEAMVHVVDGRAEIGVAGKCSALGESGERFQNDFDDDQKRYLVWN